MNIDNKIILLPSVGEFLRMSRSVLLQAYLIGWKEKNGLIFVEKNRFNGMNGTYTQEGWEKLVEQTKTFFELPENDLEDMTREQLLGQIMHLQERVWQLEDKVEPVARMLAAQKMGLTKDVYGENQPYELWSQCIPEARKFLGLE